MFIFNITEYLFHPYSALPFYDKLDNKNFLRLVEINKIAGAIFLGMILGRGPFCKGFAIGSVETASTVAFSFVLDSLFPSYLVDSEDNDNPVFEDFHDAVLVPVKEEIIFRGILQGLTKKVAEYVFKDRELFSIKGHKITIAKVVTIIVPALIFASLHDNSIIHVIGAIVYGILADQYGIAASIGAHIFNNSFCVVMSFVDEVFIDGVGRQTTAVS